MSTEQIRRFDREELMDELDFAVYGLFLEEVAEYLRLTAKETMRYKPDYIYRALARESIYRECLKAFQHDASIKSTRDALKIVYNGAYHTRIKKELQEMPTRLKQEKDASKKHPPAAKNNTAPNRVFLILFLTLLALAILCGCLFLFFPVFQVPFILFAASALLTAIFWIGHKLFSQHQSRST